MRFMLPLFLTLAATCACAFDLQGHRGARGLAPENSLPAFAKALSLGVDTLEMDTGVTRDGVVVVIHDPSLGTDVPRRPDGKWLEKAGPAVHSLTYAELSAYDVGRIKPESNYARRFSSQEPVDGTRVPKLAEVFALVKKSGNEKVRFNIETKVSPLAADETLAPEAFARALVEEIRKAGMASRSAIQSFDWRTLQVVQKIAPEIPTVYLTAQQRFLDNVCTGVKAGSPTAPASECGPSAWTAGFQLKDHGSVPRMVKAAGGKVWSPEYRDIDAARLKEARELGLKVVAWTVNDPAQMARLLELGVDGIITDRPDLLREEMRKRGMALPAATPVTP
ncbi:MAG TPA: glycerophosphodiester phosphodiesterase [Usitatibacter sp.]|nr:glycerophosphodiester phosphodiesterase [Usitatibacter sp.]